MNNAKLKAKLTLIDGSDVIYDLEECAALFDSNINREQNI